MRVFTQANPQIVLVVTDDLAAFEYVKANEPLSRTVDRADRAIRRTSAQCYIHTPSLETPPPLPPAKPTSPP